MTGAWHGVFCLGCCWALMLVAFALGMANLLWMAGLALVMTLEKRWVHGQLLARMSGVWLLVVGLTIATQELWS